MKKLICSLAIGLLACAHVPPACGDVLTLSSRRTISGTVLQTNKDNVVLLTDYATFRFSRSNLKGITIDPTSATDFRATNRLPDYKSLVRLLSKQAWASDLEQIPATVIDKGMLRNVPYVSFRCGDDYEVNLYGDLDRPAGIEAGLYRSLLMDRSARSNCVGFVAKLMGKSADQGILQTLNPQKDLRESDGLTFEITPPTDEDSYGGWWVSVYDEATLNRARASDAELKQISVTRTSESQLKAEDDGSGKWTASEMALARPAIPNSITFTNSSGTVYTNVQVVRVIDGVSLIWRDGTSGGLVKLAELPPNLQRRYGYDPAKAAAADAAQQEGKARQQQAQLQAAQGQVQPLAAQAAPTDYANTYSAYPGSSPSQSSSGSVYVRGYTRQNGTYVAPYTRKR